MYMIGNIEAIVTDLKVDVDVLPTPSVPQLNHVSDGGALTLWSSSTPALTYPHSVATEHCHGSVSPPTTPTSPHRKCVHTGSFLFTVTQKLSVNPCKI